MPHDRQNLILVRDLPRNDDPAVFEFLFQHLRPDQLAPPEIPRRVLGDFQHHLGLLLVEPDAVLVFQQLLDARRAGEGLPVRQRGAQLGEGEGLEPLAVQRGQVPDAAVVDELVGRDIGIALLAIVLAVAEADALAAQDVLFELPEGARLRRVQRLVVRPLDQQRRRDPAVQQLAQEAARQRRVQPLDTGQTGEALQIRAAEWPQAARLQPIATLDALQPEECEAFDQVALHRAQADVELLGQRPRVQRLALVEAVEDLRQAMRQLVVGGVAQGHVGPGKRKQGLAADGVFLFLCCARSTFSIVLFSPGV